MWRNEKGKQLGNALEIRNRISLYWRNVMAIRSLNVKGTASSYLDKQVYLQVFQLTIYYFTYIIYCKYNSTESHLNSCRFKFSNLFSLSLSSFPLCCRKLRLALSCLRPTSATVCCAALNYRIWSRHRVLRQQLSPSMQFGSSTLQHNVVFRETKPRTILWCVGTTYSTINQ
jgi:hypothetical protein